MSWWVQTVEGTPWKLNLAKEDPPLDYFKQENPVWFFPMRFVKNGKELKGYVPSNQIVAWWWDPDE